MDYKYLLVLNALCQCLAENPREALESPLISDLFKHYDVKVRPIYNYSEPVFVTVGLVLRQIQNLDEIRQSLKTTVNLQLFWKDEFLTWNESNYHGISKIIFPYNKNIWIPDLIIVNEVNTPGMIGLKDAFVRIYSNGQVFVWTQINIETYCEINTKQYPYDEQTCDIAFSKFMTSDDIVKLQPRINGIDLSFYAEIAEWNVKNNYVTPRLIQINESVDSLNILSNYTRIKFSITLQRSCKLCILNVILPVLVLAFLDLLAFFVPSESGEKTSFPLSLFLTLAVFLTIITQSLPESVDGVSYLGSYVTFQLAASGITLMSAVISLQIHYGAHCSTRMSKLLSFADCLEQFGNRTALRKKHDSKSNVYDLQDLKREQEISKEVNVEAETKFKNVSAQFDRLMFIVILFCQIIALTIFLACVFF
ncbi:acetylcholine receptor subunit alpha-1-B-like [Ruditapes philippinarum]|uniref:acetylcholine receptor subunit alpha-1-B-like n=1 Tax=Ruditapes philippinarum TaxID=129788 RepID=UPI00295B8391|nr:acetylcholine receptor subunit alpha-1-B-like [Ruditapes philippinarum]